MIRFNHKLIAYWSKNREVPNPSDYIIGSARVLPVGPCGYGVPKATKTSRAINRASAVVRRLQTVVSFDAGGGIVGTYLDDGDSLPHHLAYTDADDLQRGGESNHVTNVARYRRSERR